MLRRRRKYLAVVSTVEPAKPATKRKLTSTAREVLIAQATVKMTNEKFEMVIPVGLLVSLVEELRVIDDSHTQ